MQTQSKAYIFLIIQSVVILILMIVAVTTVKSGWGNVFQCQIYTENWKNHENSQLITVEGIFRDFFVMTHFLERKSM